MIKVGIITRSTLFTSRGGDTVQVLQTIENMAAHGIEAEVKLTNETINYQQYDLLHFFNITRPSDILCHILRSGKPYVVSTILVDYSEYDKYHRKGFSGMLFRMLSADGIEYCKTIGRRIMGTDKLMSLPYIWKGHKKSVKEILASAALLLPNSRSEYARLHRLYNCTADYAIVHNGINPSIFTYDATVEKDETLILCVGRIEGIKNQLNLITALNNTRYRLVIIGTASDNQQAYYQECKQNAASNIQFIEHLPQQALVHYYQKAKVHVLPSFFETTGLSSLEAAAMGCNIVISERGDAAEYFGSLAKYCEPGNPQSIFNAIQNAAASPLNSLLREKINSNYTWTQATVQTVAAYKSVIKAGA